MLTEHDAAEVVVSPYSDVCLQLFFLCRFFSTIARSGALLLVPVLLQERESFGLGVPRNEEETLENVASTNGFASSPIRLGWLALCAVTHDTPADDCPCYARVATLSRRGQAVERRASPCGAETAIEWRCFSCLFFCQCPFGVCLCHKKKTGKRHVFFPQQRNASINELCTPEHGI